MTKARRGRRHAPRDGRRTRFPAPPTPSAKLLRAVVALALVFATALGVLGAEQDAAAPPRSQQDAAAPPASPPDAGAGGSAGAPVVVRVEPGGAGVSRLRIGVTHTEHSLDAGGDVAAVARATQLLRPAIALQNQHIYGWGARNPEPSPGVFDWRSLDRRVALMRRLGAEPVLTLCCAPDWMTALGTRTSRYPNLPPAPGHVRDFAALAARIARRYPDVHRFVVWNEFKGLWDHASGTWDVARYTTLYNAVYDALKAVDRRIAVGGPYLNVRGTGSAELGRTGTGTGNPLTADDRATLTTWRRDAHGADFVAVDRNVTPRRDPNRYSRVEQLRLAHWFGDIAQQVRAATGLPVWFMEAHMDPAAGARLPAAATAAMVLGLIRGGASAALLWGPEGPAPGGPAGDPSALVTNTRVPGGGRPLPSLAVVRVLARTFPPGTPLRPVTVSSPDVAALASSRAVVVLNLRARRTLVTAAGRRAVLPPYGIWTVRPLP
jgi:hypothetical protein